MIAARARIAGLVGALAVGIGVLLAAGNARANPAGANVRHGSATVGVSGDLLEIQQTTDRAIIDWDSFSIAAGETTRFVQPGSTSAALNRVTGASMSNIAGLLEANGRVLLINPNGIVIGSDGRVDTAGFAASTLDVPDSEFLAGGDLNFQGASQAAVINLGTISAMEGDVFLVGATVRNEGTVEAPNGTVGLAAGNDVLIRESGTERVFVRGASGDPKEEGVVNTGTVEANLAELKSHGGNVYGMAVRNEGRVAATAVSKEGGQIFLRAGGGGPGAGGDVRSTGELEASDPLDEGGGDIEIDGGEGHRTEIGGEVDATVEAGGGGTVLILGRSVDVFDGSLILADGGVELRADDSIRTGAEETQAAGPVFQAGSGPVRMQTTPGAGAGGIELNDTTILTATGAVEITGHDVDGPGVRVNETEITSDSGRITLEGRAGGGDSDGLRIDDDSFLGTGEGGTIALTGEGSGTGRSLALGGAGFGGTIDDGPNDQGLGAPSLIVEPIPIIGGDGTQDVEVRSLGGDADVRLVEADEFSFRSADGATGALDLWESDIATFSSAASDGIDVDDAGGLEIGSVDSEGPVSFRADGHIRVSGPVRSDTSIALEGGPGFDRFEIRVPLEAPTKLLDGGAGEARVETQGRLDLTGLVFRDIDRVVGVSPEDRDVLVGSPRDSTIGLAPFSVVEGPDVVGANIRGMRFFGYERISGGPGDDTFEIGLGAGGPFEGALAGGPGDDRFAMFPGSVVARIDGGAGRDTLDYGRFETPVTVNFGSLASTGIGSLAGLEAAIGGRAEDRLVATAGPDFIDVTGANQGRLNDGRFAGFERLAGGPGADTFTFSDQATVAGVDGGLGFDLLGIDDRDLGGTNTYRIEANRITRNPTYRFDGIEGIQLRLGPGDDTVVTEDNGFVHVLDGGPGFDTLDIGMALGGNPAMLGNTRIFQANFEAPREEESESPGELLTTQFRNVPLPDGRGEETFTARDRFSGTGGQGLDSLASGGAGAFGSFAAGTAVAGQAVVIRVDGREYLLGAPASLDGEFAQPPPLVVDLLRENLVPEAWRELAEALDFEGPTVLVMGDGPYALDLSGVPPDEVSDVLRSNLLSEAAREIGEALPIAVGVPVTAMDGTVAILPVPAAPNAQTVALLNEQLDAAAFAELAGAMDDE